MIKRLPRTRCYFAHGIADPESAPAVSPDRITHTHPRDFEAFLAEYGATAELTFDDGYRDNLRTALPLMERYDVAATVFVTTGFIERSHPLLARLAAYVARSADWSKPSVAPWLDNVTDARAAYDTLREKLKRQGADELARHQQAILDDYELGPRDLTDDYLSRGELRELDAHPLVTIGAHTISHPDLRYCSGAELRRELAGARATLEGWLGHEIDTLAYPFGDTNARVRRAAARAGYRRAYITEATNWRSRIPAYGRLDMPRIDISGEVRRMRRRQRKALDTIL